MCPSRPEPAGPARLGNVRSYRVQPAATRQLHQRAGEIWSRVEFCEHLEKNVQKYLFEFENNAKIGWGWDQNIKRRLLHIKAAPVTQAPAQPGSSVAQPTELRIPNVLELRVQVNAARPGQLPGPGEEERPGRAELQLRLLSGLRWCWVRPPHCQERRPGRVTEETTQSHSALSTRPVLAPRAGPALLTHNWASLQLLASVTPTLCHYTPKYTRGEIEMFQAFFLFVW